MSRINKKWVDSTIVTEDLINVANGVAGLDATGKIESSYLPTSATEYKGAWNALANSPSISDATGTNGDMYRVSTNGTQDLGSGSLTFYAGDLVIHNGTVFERVPENSSFQGKTTDDLTEGSTNLYFTETRVEETIISTYTVGTNSVIANTDSVVEAFGKVQAQINAIPSGLSPQQEVVTLSATDISNGYFDLSSTPSNAIVTVNPKGGLTQSQGTDFSVSSNRITFLGDLVTYLEENDIVTFYYLA